MTNQIDDHRITVSSEAAASIHDDGIVILHTRRGSLFSSNGTGAHIWRCIEQQMPFEAIAEKISSEYQIARTTAREHTARFLAELERHSLILRGAES
jgi:Coenzyme PQQ synthesis protein D (PqqD)